MQPLATGLSYLDLDFQQSPNVIATAVLHGPGGVALIDPGPSSTLATLTARLEQAGIALSDVTAILLTHIHLDHAGATGTLLRARPSLRVYVHEKGASHLVDPSKLLASAARLYGDAMQQLWGEVAAVPASAVVPLTGGERLDISGRVLRAEYTPGHASHHVSYFIDEARLAFVGDTAGIRLRAGAYVLPPTPPPDIDLELWSLSLSAIEAARPETLFLTHFGPSEPAGPHLAEMRDHLDGVARLARASLERDGTDDEREFWFCEQVRQDVRRRVGDTQAAAYEVAARFDLSWRGLARYWRKRVGSAAGA
jgi:glyoxylase-like metal-dependent hydrolase (beta-lactamase superfamily II)